VDFKTEVVEEEEAVDFKTEVVDVEVVDFKTEVVEVEVVDFKTVVAEVEDFKTVVAEAVEVFSTKVVEATAVVFNVVAEEAVVPVIKVFILTTLQRKWASYESKEREVTPQLLEASGSASGELIEGGGDSTFGGSASVLEPQPGPSTCEEAPGESSSAHQKKRKGK
ncbi:unnamed protein product, partial [Mesocestoides corti]